MQSSGARSTHTKQRLPLRRLLTSRRPCLVPIHLQNVFAAILAGFTDASQIHTVRAKHSHMIQARKS